MKDMSEYYLKQSTHNLLRLKSQKQVRKDKLMSTHMGYFDLQEVRTLVQQIKWIDAVLASRADQMQLPL